MAYDGDSAGSEARWDVAAQQAASRVHALFGHRLMALPGTWIARVRVPAAHRQTPWSPWHYWWQAHYLDALVDAGLRANAAGRPAAARGYLLLGQALLRGIGIRNLLHFPNYFYDDMAWLALAAARLGDFSARLGAGRLLLAGHVVSVLSRQLVGAQDDVLGGGLYWSRKRDFKNTPANGPAALLFARLGHQDRARAVVDWLGATLRDPEQGLYFDGVHPRAEGPEFERTIYTYNQGPVLAALLELDQPRYLADAADLVAAVDRSLATAHVLRCHEGDDGSLFTGILVRYLALAAADPRLPGRSRATAATLVRGTADTMRVVPESPRPGHPAVLSAELQRWMVLEAAASLDRCPDR